MFPVATITMRSGEKISVELRPDQAPNTVASFIHLAGLGIYRGHAIERIAPDFVADMSFTAFGREEARYLIPYETKDAGFPNELPALPGAIVMGGYDQGIAGGEFFFLFAEKEKITWHYPAFGTVTSGWDTIAGWNRLAVKEIPVPGDPSVRVTVPLAPPVIADITVETFGESYPLPEKIKDAPLPGNWTAVL